MVLSAVLLVVLVGFSRVALGAHFLTDVLAAVVFGIIWLMLCLLAGRPLRRRSLRSPAILPLPNSCEAVLASVEQPAQPVQLSKTN